METTLFAAGFLAWITTGVLGGQMLSYPGDGLNPRHILGAAIGPLALCIALFELAFAD